MAKVEFSPGIERILGALDTKHQLIMRQKHLHDTNGSLTKECDSEVYLQKRKRDYEQTPPQGNELAHLQHLAKRQSARQPSSMPISSPTQPPMSNAPFLISTAVVLSLNSKVHRIPKLRSTKRVSRSTISASIISSAP